MKKVILILLAAVAAVSLAACNREAPANSATEAPQEEQVEVLPEEPTPEPTPAQAPAADSSQTETAGDPSLEDLSAAAVEETVSALTAELDTLVADCTTYDAYIENIDRVEAFYARILSDTQALCIRLREYGADYAESVLTSGDPSDEMRDARDELFDVLYDDIGDDIFDEIYDDLLDDLFDAFYDGVISDASDTVTFDEWSDVHSAEYDRWSDTRSDLYDEWSDYRSDIYDLWSDIGSELWDDDVEKALEDVADFREDIEKRKTDTAAEPAESDVPTAPASEEAPAEETPAVDSSSSVDASSEELVDGMRPDFKAAMDSYESFVDEYCAFMEKYSESDGTDISLLADYASFLAEYADMTSSFEDWDDSDMNDVELAYYLEVQARTSQKLLTAAQ